MNGNTKKDKLSETTQNSESVASRQIVVHAQYIKDLSFESPNAPEILMESPNQPDVEITVNVGAQSLGDSQFEVLLNIGAKAKANDKALFLVELTYAGIVSCPDCASEDVNSIVMIEAPRLLFPFARAIVSDVTRDGGFMPLNIQPVDFVAVYQHNLAKQQEAASKTKQ